MKRLSAAELLTVWEAGLGQSLIEKSLRLAGAVYSEPNIRVLATLSIGQRDALLMQIRKGLFGSKLSGLAACPRCSGKVEWEMSLDEFAVQKLQQEPVTKEFNLQVNGFALRYRLLNSLDVAKAAAHPERYDSRKLLAGCLLAVQHHQQDFSPDDLPQEVYEEMDRQMEKADPEANIQLSLRCPDCLHQWSATFDILSYLWTEIDDWAKRLLIDIASLAKAFGWAERDILSMTAQRRQFYLQLIRS